MCPLHSLCYRCCHNHVRVFAFHYVTAAMFSIHKLCMADRRIKTERDFRHQICVAYVGPTHNHLLVLRWQLEKTDTHHIINEIVLHTMKDRHLMLRKRTGVFFLLNFSFFYCNIFPTQLSVVKGFLLYQICLGGSKSASSPVSVVLTVCF